MQQNEHENATAASQRYGGLDRRRKTSEKLLKQRSRFLSSTEWLRQLELCCQRFAKSNRVFSAAQLGILQYRHVKQRIGEEAAFHLEDKVRTAIDQVLRAEDAVLSVGNGQFLLLFGDTTQQETREILDRLSEAVAEDTNVRDGQRTRISCTYHIAAAGAETEREITITRSTSPKELVRELGFEVDQRGKVHARDRGNLDESDGELFLGDFWLWAV
ncbi:MAG TPA: diguanylate cyclase, partial [Candidatus Obscuribacterales bacterium]